MNVKKTVTLLFAVMMGQMVVASDVDLYRGLLFWIKIIICLRFHSLFRSRWAV